MVLADIGGGRRRVARGHVGGELVAWLDGAPTPALPGTIEPAAREYLTAGDVRDLERTGVVAPGSWAWPEENEAGPRRPRATRRAVQLSLIGAPQGRVRGVRP